MTVTDRIKDLLGKKLQPRKIAELLGCPLQRVWAVSWEIRNPSYKRTWMSRWRDKNPGVEANRAKRKRMKKIMQAERARQRRRAEKEMALIKGPDCWYG